jgi:hypothetical protein
MKPVVLVGALAAAAALCTSSFSYADPPQVTSLWQAPTTTLQERGGPTARYLTQAGGAGLFLGSYIPSVVVGAVSSRNDDKRLFIPVAGPWLDLGERDCTARTCNAKLLTGALLAIDGVAQAVGVIAFLGGTLAAPTEKKVETPTIHVGPAHIGYDGYGVSAAGTWW